MSRMTSPYPERVHSVEEERALHRLAEKLRSSGRSRGMLLGGLIGIGIGAWMVWHFGPDLMRYIKMERM